MTSLAFCVNLFFDCQNTLGQNKPGSHKLNELINKFCTKKGVPI